MKLRQFKCRCSYSTVPEALKKQQKKEREKKATTTQLKMQIAMFIIILMVAPMFNIEYIRRLMPCIKHPFIFTFLQLVKMLRSKFNTDRLRKKNEEEAKKCASKENIGRDRMDRFFPLFFRLVIVCLQRRIFRIYSRCAVPYIHLIHKHTASIAFTVYTKRLRSTNNFQINNFIPLKLFQTQSKRRKRNAKEETKIKRTQFYDHSKSP